jgi:hypothetical protein
MLPFVPPIEVSRLWLLGLVAAAALIAVTTSQPLSSFAAGFAAGAGIVFVIATLKNPRGREREPQDPT